MVQETPIWDGKDLGHALRDRRRRLGFLQSKVAQDLGYSERLISEIENGRETVAYGKILRYAGYLGLVLVLQER